MEVTSSTAAQMVLHFGFVSRTLLVTHPCFGSHCSACTASRFHLSPLHPLQQVGRGGQDTGRGHSWDSLPEWTKAILQAIQHHAQQQKLRRGWAEVCSWEVATAYAPPYRLFLHLLNCLDPHTQEFSLLLFPFSPSPSHCRKGGSSWVVLSCWPGSTLVKCRISFFG